MSEDGLGILPGKEELQKTAEAKPKPAKSAGAPKKGKVKRASLVEDEPTPHIGTQILVLKTQVGQEKRVVDALGGKARRFGIPIQGLLSPAELRGFVFVETTDPLAVEKGIRGVSYARALVTRAEELRDPEGNFIKDRRGKIVTRKVPVDTPFDQIAHFLTPVSAVSKIAEGDIVELVSGPFRGEKAKVTRVDDVKEEIVVELIEAMVPIPITVKGEHVRVLEKSH